MDFRERTLPAGPDAYSEENVLLRLNGCILFLLCRVRI